MAKKKRVIDNPGRLNQFRRVACCYQMLTAFLGICCNTMKHKREVLKLHPQLELSYFVRLNSPKLFDKNITNRPKLLLQGNCVTAAPPGGLGTFPPNNELYPDKPHGPARTRPLWLLGGRQKNKHLHSLWMRQRIKKRWRKIMRTD